MSKIQKSVLLVTTALSLTAPVSLRAADTVVAAGQNGVEEVVVTARRREERLQDVPISISVFNQQQLSNRNVVNAQDLVKFTPSLSANNNFGSQNSNFAIRGFFQDIGTAPSVGVFFDDVVAPRGATQGIAAGDGAGPGDFFDLQNVQVLKGPQGTLFGINTTGGDILLVPTKPTDQFEGYAQGTFGNYNALGGQGVINIPVNDQVRLRFGVDHLTRDGYVINTSGIGPRDFDDVNYTALRGSADIDITPDLNDYIVASYTNSDTHGDFQKLIACDPKSPLSSATLFNTIGGACGQITPGAPNYQGSSFYDAAQDIPNAFSKLTIWRVINTTTWHVSDNVTVKNIASYAQLKDTNNSALFGTNLSPAYGALGRLPPSILNIIGLKPSDLAFHFEFASLAPLPSGSANSRTYTDELQFQGTALDNRLTWQAGGYIENTEPLTVVGANSPGLIVCANALTYQCTDNLGYIFTAIGNIGTNPLDVPENRRTHIGDVNYTAGTTTYNDVAGYGQATYNFTDELSLTGGIRYTSDRIADTTTNITHINFGFPGEPYRNTPFCTFPGADAACTRHLLLHTSAPTWLVDLDYKPNDDMLFYAKWARGYRSGVIVPNIAAPFNYVHPERLDDYEAGAKTTWDYNGITGTFNVNGFYEFYFNQQLLLGFDQNQCFTHSSSGACLPAPVAPTAAPVNAGKSRVYGLELDTSVVPYEGLTFQLGYTYLRSELVEVKHFELPPTSLYVIAANQVVGARLPLAPTNKVSVTASYVLPLEDSIGKITLSTTFTHTDQQLVNYIDSTYNNPANPALTAQIRGLSQLQATNLLDLSVNWEQVLGHSFDLSFFATNVTGDQYYTWIPGLSNAIGFETANLGEPTFYGGRVTIHFGGAEAAPPPPPPPK
jgi:iron complex outermembrane receptor protein